MVRLEFGCFTVKRKTVLSFGTLKAVAFILLCTFDRSVRVFDSILPSRPILSSPPLSSYLLESDSIDTHSNQTYAPHTKSLSRPHLLTPHRNISISSKHTPN